MKTDRSTGALKPQAGRWRRRGDLVLVTPGTGCWWWSQAEPIAVCSALEQADTPDNSGDVIPQWHLSIAGIEGAGAQHLRPRRVIAAELRLVVSDFGLEQFEIDNHEPGVAQHVWIPLDPARRVDCECKSDETIVVEADGHTWTTPVDGPCRGCAYQDWSGRRCPLHDPAPRPGDKLTAAQMWELAQ